MSYYLLKKIKYSYTCETWYKHTSSVRAVHRKKGPALIKFLKNGKYEQWYIMGVRYIRRDDCLVVKKDLTFFYRKLENIVPTIIYDNDTKEWWKTSFGFMSKQELHRTEFPAIIYSNGDEEWWQNGKRHRVGGPAVTYGNKKYFYEFGELIDSK
jgi:hypothetical protein